MNILTAIKDAKCVLFTDDEHFNKEITGVKNLNDVKEMFCIRGDIYKINSCHNEYEYKLKNSDYKFVITIIN